MSSRFIAFCVTLVCFSSFAEGGLSNGFYKSLWRWKQSESMCCLWKRLLGAKHQSQHISPLRTGAVFRQNACRMCSVLIMGLKRNLISLFSFLGSNFSVSCFALGLCYDLNLYVNRAGLGFIVSYIFFLLCLFLFHGPGLLGIAWRWWSLHQVRKVLLSVHMYYVDYPFLSHTL